MTELKEGCKDLNRPENQAATSGSRKQKLKPATLLAPVPVVLVSCCGLPGGERAKPNLITVAWTGTICSDPPMVAISIRPSRYSHQQIRETGEFVVNLVDRSLLRAADFCGVRSGKDMDKFAACNLNTEHIPGLLYAQAVAESPLQLACKVRQTISLGSHDCFMGEVVAVQAADNLMDQQGRLCLEKADLLAYLHGDYHRLGERVGFFGFSVASQKVLNRRLMPAKFEKKLDKPQEKNIRHTARKNVKEKAGRKRRSRGIDRMNGQSD